MGSLAVLLQGLNTGERMSREEFLRRWDELPDLKKAELIDGVVYVASPVSMDHAEHENLVGFWLRAYTLRMPGCRCGNNATWLMLESAPQADSFLAYATGQGDFSGTYGQGAPELTAEICVSSSARDFGPKLALYQRAGVREYITFETKLRRITWRSLGEDGSYREITPDSDGLLPSRVFPGLTLNAEAFWLGDATRVSNP